MKGVGYCCVLISWYVSFYYNVIIGWTVFFIITTITSGESECAHFLATGVTESLRAGERLPWQHCDNEWNTGNCYSLIDVMLNHSSAWENRTSPAQEFFE